MEKFEVKTEVIRKMQDEQLRKEQLLFLTLCSEEDRQRINGERVLTVWDFERITCLFYNLGLLNYLFAFEVEHSNLIQQLGWEIEQDIKSMNPEKRRLEVQNVIKWLEDFCQQLPSPAMQEHFKELFEIR